MANTTLSDPPRRELVNSTLSNPIPPWKNPQAIGWEGFGELEKTNEIEVANEGPVKPHEILGSIPFKTVVEKAGEGAVDAAREAFGLTKYILGVGGEEIYAPQGSAGGQAENVAQKAWENSAGATTEPSDLEKARFVVYRIKRFEELDQSLSIEERKKLMSESLRMTGREITENEAKDEGYLDKTAVATLIGIAKKEGEVKDEVEEKQEEVVENELDKRIWGADLKRNFEDQNMAGPG